MLFIVEKAYFRFCCLLIEELFLDSLSGSVVWVIFLSRLNSIFFFFCEMGSLPLILCVRLGLNNGKGFSG